MHHYLLTGLLALLAGCSIADAVPLPAQASGALAPTAAGSSMPAPREPFDATPITPMETVGAAAFD